MTSRHSATITDFNDCGSPYDIDPLGELENLTDEQLDDMRAECKAEWLKLANYYLSDFGLLILGNGEIILRDANDDNCLRDRLCDMLDSEDLSLSEWLSREIILPDFIIDRWMDINSGKDD